MEKIGNGNTNEKFLALTVDEIMDIQGGENKQFFDSLIRIVLDIFDKEIE